MTLSGAKDAAGNQMDRRHLDLHHRCERQRLPLHHLARLRRPATPATADSSAVEVGVKFRPSQAGYITGIRFYKGTGNTGTHVGSLWNRRRHQAGLGHLHWRDRHRVADARPSARRVPVAANTTYVASYYAPVGRYASNNSYFAVGGHHPRPADAR